MALAIKESGVDRADIFLTTKLWPKDYGIGTTREAALASLKRLDTDYLDLVTLPHALSTGIKLLTIAFSK